MVAVGVTVIDEPLAAPGFQVYVNAPVADKVAVLPIHKIVGVFVAVIMGTLTFSEIVFVFVQPVVFVPVTEYVVVIVGDTATEFPVKAPGFQV